MDFIWYILLDRLIWLYGLRLIKKFLLGIFVLSCFKVNVYGVDFGSLIYR